MATKEVTERKCPAHEYCECGRWMGTIFAVDTKTGKGVSIRWCAGCGTVNVHYEVDDDNSRYVVNPAFKGKP